MRQLFSLAMIIFLGFTLSCKTPVEEELEEQSTELTEMAAIKLAIEAGLARHPNIEYYTVMGASGNMLLSVGMYDENTVEVHLDEAVIRFDVSSNLDNNYHRTSSVLFRICTNQGRKQM